MIQNRLAALRKLMKKHKIEAYLVPSTDAHQSEYVPALWQRRPWISGFTGSAGDVLILETQAGLWTDSRYFLQAEQQLRGTGIDLYKLGVPGEPTLLQFIKKSLEAGMSVGVDPKLHSYKEMKQWQNELGERGIKIKFIEDNLVDNLWEDQPGLPSDDIIVWEDKFSGENVESKLSRIREQMKEEGIVAHVISTLDAIAWTFNIRGHDVDYNPVVIANAIITEDKALLFVNKKK